MTVDGRLRKGGAIAQRIDGNLASDGMKGRRKERESTGRFAGGVAGSRGSPSAAVFHVK